MTRRDLLNGGMFGAATGAQQQGSGGLDPRQVRDIVAHLNTIADELERQNDGCFTGACGVTEKLRDQMTLFLRANGKYPDVMEVGTAVFHAAYDWHIRNRLALVVGRSPDGRYGLGFMFTRLILRHDVAVDFVGLPYDVRA